MKCKNCGKRIKRCDRECIHKGWVHSTIKESHYCYPNKDYPDPGYMDMAEPE